MGFYVEWTIESDGISQNWGQCRSTQRKDNCISACAVFVDVVFVGCVTGVVPADEPGDRILRCLAFILIGQNQIHAPKSPYLNVREPVHLCYGAVSCTNGDVVCVMLQMRAWCTYLRSQRPYSPDFVSTKGCILFTSPTVTT